MRTLRSFFVASLVCCLVLPLHAGSLHAEEASPAKATAELPEAKPETVGMSSEKLAQIAAVSKQVIEAKELAGAVTVVARKGKVVWFDAQGAFEKDSIFRIYSMTKPVTVVAALSLIEAGKLGLDDPVEKHLPAMKGVRVAGSDKPATPMTVKQLMMHTAGLTYGFFGNTPSDRAYRKAKLLDRESTLEEMVAKLGKLPLVFEPGTQWRYGVATDVLGRVVEVAAGKPLDVVFQERIFGPLGMTDTAFAVPDAKIDRFVGNYSVNQVRFEHPKTSPYRTKPGLLSGGGGLVSTARDYTIFALMLAQGGRYGDTRILKEATVKQMTTNHLPKEQQPIRIGPIPMVGMGFGLGVSVRTGAAYGGGRLGDWGWAGAASTSFFVSPTEELVVVVMSQRMPTWNQLDLRIRPLVYAALTPVKRAEEKPVGAGAADK